MDYYKEMQDLAVVDQEDNIIGKMEKWEAHKKGVLHRAYTAILQYEDSIILQHRKHPLFDDVYDLSFSSHQIYKNDSLQTNEEALYEGLEREWGIEKFEIRNLKFINKIYYKAKDEKSEFFDHEIDYIYLIEVNTMPKANLDYAYGQKMIQKANIISEIKKLQLNLAPWVEKILEMKLF
ncbi:MAG: hypothetical protein AAB929_00900 [Patescibacteria group bacterium]